MKIIISNNKITTAKVVADVMMFIFLDGLQSFDLDAAMAFITATTTKYTRAITADIAAPI